MLKILFVILIFINTLNAKEKANVEQILKEIFPNSTIEVKNIILSKEQVEKVEKLSGMKIDTRLISWYFVKNQNNIIKYAYVDSHIVRTHQEVVLYVINPDGKIDFIKIIAFGEPLEYMPDENWLKLFKGKEFGKDAIRLRKDIPNMTASTLTSRAITDNTRKVLAIWQILFGSEQR